jgi:hypothetical protein
MLADGYLVGDGSWNLRVYVTDLQVERTLRVKGDLHIGGVMLKLVEDLGKFKINANLVTSQLKDEWSSLAIMVKLLYHPSPLRCLI